MKYKVNKDGVLIFSDSDNELIVIPNEYRKQLLLQYHDGALGGHLSARKTLSKITIKYHWPNIKQSVIDWCKQCAVRATRRNTGKPVKVPLKPLPPPAGHMELCAMDVLGPLPITIQNNKYIIVFCDYFSKWTIISYDGSES